MYRTGDLVRINEQHRKGDRFRNGTVARVVDYEDWRCGSTPDLKDGMVYVAAPLIELSRVIGYGVEVGSEVDVVDLTLIGRLGE